jgi:hypothetical protein
VINLTSTRSFRVSSLSSFCIFKLLYIQEDKDKRFLKQYRMISGHKIEFDLFVGGV